jgi:sulfur relay protein TusB/DsrH
VPKTAFLVLKSPQELDPTHMVKRFAEKGEASIILVEDGVYQALLPSAAQRLSGSVTEVLVSRDDLEARGFSAFDLKTGKAVEYAEIVDCIMERTERTITV